MKTPTRTPAVLMSLLASAALLSACDRTDENTTTGQRTDEVVAQNERQEERSSAGDTGTVRETGPDAGQTMKEATDAVANKSRDMAITAAVNARLAGDERLSALAIDVDTADGRVVLRGTAPDTAARSRATELTRDVDGVREVSNELTVQPGNTTGSTGGTGN